MPGYDFRSPRLYVDAPLERGRDGRARAARRRIISRTVLRLKSGHARSRLQRPRRRVERDARGAQARRRASVGAQTRAQTAAADLHYLFAPLKAARLDYMVQKAVEMGVSRLQPVLTRHGQVARVNARAHARQCHRGRRAMRHSFTAGDRAAARARAPPRRAGSRRACLVFCDEDAEVANPVAALARCRRGRRLRCWSVPKVALPKTNARPCSSCRMSSVFALGPRILRADTAAVAALALVQAVVGDWR